MELRMLGTQMMMLNVLRRNLVHQKTMGYELHHGQLPLLETIINFPDSTQQELAQRLKVTPASIAQSTTRLSRAGLIEKRMDPQNKRCNRLVATAAGKHAAVLYRNSFDEVDACTFSCLNEEERTLLSGLFDRMIQNMNDGAEFLSFPFCWKGESKE